MDLFKVLTSPIWTAVSVLIVILASIIGFIWGIESSLNNLNIEAQAQVGQNATYATNKTVTLQYTNIESQLSTLQAEVSEIQSYLYNGK